nr:uncharacterized protein LOC108825044 [Ipomoea trifida]
MPKLSLASQKSPKSKEIKEYGDIFPKEMREGLPPMRDKEHQIDLVSKASLLNRPPYRYGAKKAKWVWAIYEQVSRQINDNAYKLALQDPEDSWTNLPKNWEMLRPTMVARLEPNKSPQQRRPSSQQHANEASSQDIPESQPIPDSAPENPSHEIEVGDHMVYNDEMPGETKNTSHEFEVETDEIHTPNIPSETETPFVEVDVGHEDVQLVQVPFLREQRAVQQPPKK